ncbi:MAG: FxsA family protein [Acidobacteriota bacterium]|nr:FxsA family protein [Acidobacteriota bacterium]
MLWFVLLVLWPLAELYVIIKLSEAIGFLWVLLLLIVSWPIGSRVIRHEGRAALRRLRGALAAGRAPTNEVVDGALVLVGGLLLLVPGFITDVIGLLMLLPPTRALARRGALRNHRSAWLQRAVSFVSWGARGGRGGRGADPRGYDAEATAADIDEPQLEA